MRALLLSLWMIVAVPALATENPVPVAPTDRGPAVGEMIPSDLSSLDQTGTPANFDALVGKKGLVLVFIRSTKWCPFCKKQLIDLATGVEEIKAHGYQLAALSYDSLDDIERYVDEYQPGFTVLSDRQSEVIDAFGIRNEKYGKFHFANGVPHPLIFVIGPDRIIQAKLAEEGYKNRPAVTLVIETLDGLAKPDQD